MKLGCRLVIVLLLALVRRFERHVELFLRKHIEYRESPP